MAGPGSFGACHVLSLNQYAEIMIFPGNRPGCFQFLANREVQLVAGSIVRGDDESVLGRFDVALGNGAHAFFCVGNFLNTALLL